MNPEIEKDLLEKYPQLFMQFEGFSCGNGWAVIIDALCSLFIGEENPPSIRRIYEKYGILRCEIDKLSEKNIEHVRFAIAMSRRTCEECGGPGVTRTGKNLWLTTACERHAPEGSTIL